MKIRSQKNSVLTFAVVAIAFALAARSSSAAVIGTLTTEAPNSSSDHNGTIDAVVGDLIETDGSVASEGGNGTAARHVTASVYNGKISTGVSNTANGGDPNADNAAGYWGSGTPGTHFIEFDLDTTTNTLGYDISLINIIQKGDGARPDISVAVSLREIGGSFTQIYDNRLSPLGTAGNVNQIQVTDNGPALLGTGIDGIRFDFGDTNPTFGWTWYRELDVVGTATLPPPTPEPSTAILAALGFVGLVGTRRRRRK